MGLSRWVDHMKNCYCWVNGWEEIRIVSHFFEALIIDIRFNWVLNIWVMFGGPRFHSFGQLNPLHREFALYLRFRTVWKQVASSILFDRKRLLQLMHESSSMSRIWNGEKNICCLTSLRSIWCRIFHTEGKFSLVVKDLVGDSVFNETWWLTGVTAEQSLF